MHLLQLQDDGEFSLVEYVGTNIPPYAILSHTWGANNEEVTFEDLKKSAGKTKTGYRKLQFCGWRAAYDGLQFYWIDTCCIDKSNSTELSEAINSMFNWYRNAFRCYVYLSDVTIGTSIGWELAFRQSKWFTRGWTLQELLAPTVVEFFSADGQRLGNRISLQQEIYSITGIPIQALQGCPLSQFTIDERMSWAESRCTTREEDAAYSLLGIFDVCMLPIYGEGRKRAFIRLRQDITNSSNYNPEAEDFSPTRANSNGALTRTSIPIPTSNFTFLEERTHSHPNGTVVRESVRASGYPDSIPYDKKFKENRIRPAGDEIIRARSITNLYIRGQATDIPEGKYDVKWIFCFPELRYVQLLSDDCPIQHRMTSIRRLPRSIGHNFNIWLDNKFVCMLLPFNLSLSVGVASSNNVISLNKNTSPADTQLQPGYRETKLSQFSIEEHRNEGWCELDSDEIVYVGKEGQMDFVVWKKFEPSYLPGFAFGGVRLQPAD